MHVYVQSVSGEELLCEAAEADVFTLTVAQLFQGGDRRQ